MQSGPINPGAVYGAAADDMELSAASDGAYDSGDVDALLISLVNNMAIARRAAEWLDPRYFTTYLGAEDWQMAVWAALRDILLQSSEDPTAEYLARSSYHFAMRLYGDEDVAGAARAAVLEIVGIPPLREISEGILKHLYSKCVMGPEVQSLMVEARDSQDWAQVMQQLDELKTRRTQNLVDEKAAAEVDAFAVLDRVDIPLHEDTDPIVQSRVVTGLPYMDGVHGGKGIYRGFTTLVAGPTGGGKTVVNYELVASLTSQNLSVGMFATEEDLSVDLEARARLWAACSDITASEWVEAQCDPRRLENGIADAQLMRLRNMRSFLKVYSLDPVTWSCLEAELENHYLINNNTMHDVVIIDWAGPLAEAMVANRECENTHGALERICMWATQRIARRYQCAVVIFHQLQDAAVKKKGIHGKYAKGDTQNCHKMSHHCAAMHVITPRNPDERGRYCGVKTRFDKEGTEVLIQLDYQHGRFLDIGEIFELRAGDIVSKRSDGASQMPGGEKKTRVGDAL